MASIMDPVYADTRAPTELSDAEWQQLRDNLRRALIMLLVELPYFGAMAAAMSSDIVWIDKPTDIRGGEPFHTLATDGKRLYVWPLFALHAPIKFLIAALLHELLHNVLLHPLRGVGYDASLANQAMDYSVNLMVNDAALRQWIGDDTRLNESHYARVRWYIPVNDEFCVDERFRDENGDPMLWERIYALLDGSHERRLLDNHAAWTPANRPADTDGKTNRERLNPTDVRRWVQAAQQFKDHPTTRTLPGIILRRIDEAIYPTLPWPTLLQAYLTPDPGDYAWAPGDLRFVDPMPCWIEEPALRFVTFGFDISGSMTDRQIAACVANARSLLASFPNVKGRVYLWDTKVHHACDLDAFDAVVRAGLTGGGGTSIAPQFAAIADDGIAHQTTVHVCFTDGIVDWQTVDPDTLPYDVLWVIAHPDNRPPEHPRYRWTRLEIS